MSDSSACATWLRPALLAAFALCSPLAAATCAPVPHVRYVGDTASDAQCTDNDIQSAIDNSVCPTTIVISREHLYTAQHLVISNKTLTLTATGDGVGCGPPGICDPQVGCTPPPTTPQVTLDGAGHSGDSVIHIDGTSHVTLRYLHITGGDPGAFGRGGGIGFNGAGSLTLDTTTVDNNTAGNGGGIDVSGTGAGATLTLQHNTLVLNNTATAGGGGGIRVAGSARLFMLADASSVSFNAAPNGDGGGIAVIGPARADIGSPGVVLAGAVSNNSAVRGGGMALIADTGKPVVRLFSTNPTRPVLVSNNTADKGGGIYLISNDDHAQGDDVCLFDYRVNGNSASDGAAIYADEDFRLLGSSVYLNPPGNCGPEPPATLGAVACAPGIACNEMSDNATLDGNGQPTQGAVVRLHDYVVFAGDRLDMRGNMAGTLVHSDGNFADSRLANCLLADNHTAHELVRDDGGFASFSIENCTLAHNTIDDGYALHFVNLDEPTPDHYSALVDSVIDMPGVQTLDYSGDPANLLVSYVLSNDVTTLPPIEGVAVGEPTFVDAANGDYHLQPDSLGIDFAPPVSGDDRDLDGLPHDQDLSGAGNLWGVRDLGAYEHQLADCETTDTVFCNGFEAF